VAHGDGQAKDGSGVTHGVNDLPVKDIVDLDHLIQPSTENPLLPNAIKREAGDRLLMVADCSQTSSSCRQIPHPHDRSARAQDHASARVREDGLDSVAIVGHSHLGVARSGVPELDGRVVGTSKNLVRGGGKEGAGSDVIGVAGEGHEGGRRGKVPEGSGGVVGAGEEVG
jgi:hypothetical protein